jgi:signal peptidase I
MTEAAEPKGPPPFFSRQNLWYWVRLIGIVLFIKGCVVDQYRIPSRSMEPTLHAGGFFSGDRILVNKWIMGPRIPFTTIRLWDWYEPQRWDIVVFHTIEPGSREKVLVKRIVGLPGEKIQLYRDHLRINGEKVDFPDFMPDNMWYFVPQDIPKIRDPNTRAYFEAMQRQDPIRFGVGEDAAFTTIPPDHYLMLGDNTAESHDGRMYGWVPRDHIYGRVFAIWWPFERLRDFTGFYQTWWGPFAVWLPLGALLVWIVWDLLVDLRWVLRRKKQ